MKFSIEKDSKYFCILVLEDLEKEKSCLFPFGFIIYKTISNNIYGWKLNIGLVFSWINLQYNYVDFNKKDISTGFQFMIFPKLVESFEICWYFTREYFWNIITRRELPMNRV